MSLLVDISQSDVVGFLDVDVCFGLFTSGGIIFSTGVYLTATLLLTFTTFSNNLMSLNSANDHL